MRLRIAVALELGLDRRGRPFNPTEIVGPTALAALPTLNVSGARLQWPVGCPSTLAREDRPTRSPVLRISAIAILVKDGEGGTAGWTVPPGSHLPAT
jgi:hypothetical protein